MKLYGFSCNQIDIPEITLSKGRAAFETRPLQERYHLMQLVAWLMGDLEEKLRLAWKTKAVRYNYLIKDFENAPDWYFKIVRQFSDWRTVNDFRD